MKVALNTITLTPISEMEGAFNPILIIKKIYEIHKNELFLKKVTQLKITFQLRWEILCKLHRNQHQIQGSYVKKAVAC